MRIQPAGLFRARIETFKTWRETEPSLTKPKGLAVCRWPEFSSPKPLAIHRRHHHPDQLPHRPQDPRAMAVRNESLPSRQFDRASP
jgi:hypothetical protein